MKNKVAEFNKRLLPPPVKTNGGDIYFFITEKCNTLLVYKATKDKTDFILLPKLKTTLDSYIDFLSVVLIEDKIYVFTHTEDLKYQYHIFLTKEEKWDKVNINLKIPDSNIPTYLTITSDLSIYFLVKVTTSDMEYLVRAYEKIQDL